MIIYNRKISRIIIIIVQKKNKSNSAEELIMLSYFSKQSNHLELQQLAEERSRLYLTFQEEQLRNFTKFCEEIDQFFSSQLQEKQEQIQHLNSIADFNKLKSNLTEGIDLLLQYYGLGIGNALNLNEQKIVDILSAEKEHYLDPIVREIDDLKECSSKKSILQLEKIHEKMRELISNTKIKKNAKMNEKTTFDMHLEMMDSLIREGIKKAVMSNECNTRIAILKQEQEKISALILPLKDHKTSNDINAGFLETLMNLLTSLAKESNVEEFKKILQKYIEDLQKAEEKEKLLTDAQSMLDVLEKQKKNIEEADKNNGNFRSRLDHYKSVCEFENNRIYGHEKSEEIHDNKKTELATLNDKIFQLEQEESKRKLFSIPCEIHWYKRRQFNLLKIKENPGLHIYRVTEKHEDGSLHDEWIVKYNRNDQYRSLHELPSELVENLHAILDQYKEVPSGPQQRMADILLQKQIQKYCGKEYSLLKKLLQDVYKLLNELNQSKKNISDHLSEAGNNPTCEQIDKLKQFKIPDSIPADLKLFIEKLSTLQKSNISSLSGEISDTAKEHSAVISTLSSLEGNLTAQKTRLKKIATEIKKKEQNLENLNRECEVAIQNQINELCQHFFVQFYNESQTDLDSSAILSIQFEEEVCKKMMVVLNGVDLDLHLNNPNELKHALKIIYDETLKDYQVLLDIVKECIAYDQYLVGEMGNDSKKLIEQAKKLSESDLQKAADDYPEKPITLVHKFAITQRILTMIEKNPGNAAEVKEKIRNTLTEKGFVETILSANRDSRGKLFFINLLKRFLPKSWSQTLFKPPVSERMKKNILEIAKPLRSDFDRRGRTR